MIDLDATGPVYRGHKLARIVNEHLDGYIAGASGSPLAGPVTIATKGWAKLDLRVLGNVWGLSVSDIPPSE